MPCWWLSPPSSTWLRLSWCVFVCDILSFLGCDLVVLLPAPEARRVPLQMSVGLLSVTASVYQMLRGAEMLFAACFTVTILKRRALYSPALSSPRKSTPCLVGAVFPARRGPVTWNFYTQPPHRGFSCRSLERKHYIGLLCCFVGILLVGASSLMNGSGGVEAGATKILVGMGLIVLAQANCPLTRPLPCTLYPSRIAALELSLQTD